MINISESPSLSIIGKCEQCGAEGVAHDSDGCSPRLRSRICENKSFLLRHSICLLIAIGIMILVFQIENREALAWVLGCPGVIGSLIGICHSCCCSSSNENKSDLFGLLITVLISIGILIIGFQVEQGLEITALVIGGPGVIGGLFGMCHLACCSPTIFQKHKVSRNLLTYQSNEYSALTDASSTNSSR